MNAKKAAIAIVLWSVASAVCGSSEGPGPGSDAPGSTTTGLPGLQTMLAGEGLGALSTKAFIGCTGAEAWRRKMPCRRGGVD